MDRGDKIDPMPVVLLGLLTLLVGFMPIPWDPDLWFHLADGDYILSHHAVPQADPFSFTRPGALWVPHSWLFDVGASWSWHHLGPRATEACMAVVFAVTALVSYRILRTAGVAPLPAVGICLAAAIGAGNTRGIRPQVLSLLLCNVVILMLVGHARIPRWRPVFLLPGIFLLWAQVHGAVVLGLAVVGVWLAGRSFEAAIYRQLRLRRREIGILAAALAASVAAVLITPHRITLFRYLWLTMKLRPLAYTEEWQVPHLLPVEVPDIYLYMLIAAAIVVLARCRRPVSFAPICLGTALILLALTGVRHIPLAWIGVMPMLAEALRAGDVQVVRPWSIGWRPMLAAGVLGTVLLAAFWRYPVSIDQRYASREATRGVKALQTYWDESVPRDESTPGPSCSAGIPTAVSTCASSGRQGRPLRVFTTHNTGSYVLFADPSRLKVFIDSRPDVYGDEIFFPALDAMRGAGWEDLFEKWSIDAAVLQRQDRLADILLHAPGWRVLAEDPGALTFSRRKPLGR
jgi:hypothetical protein